MLNRYAELDALRGLAVLSMIGYHLCFDLAYFYGWNIPIDSMPFSLWAKGTAGMFLLVMGVCFTISWSRQYVMLSGAQASGKDAQRVDEARLYPKYLKRGLKILTGGMLISMITYFVAPEAFVKFGILHLIGVSAMIQPLFVRFGKWNVLTGLTIIFTGIYLRNIHNLPYLPTFPLGITSPTFASLDYYPLFPWFGVVLIGMAIGKLLYIPHSHLPTCLPAYLPTCLTLIGRHALPIYFLHQPLLLILLYPLFLLFPLL